MSFGCSSGLFCATIRAFCEEFLRPDPWEALQVGCELWIDAHLDPAVQRIAMRDARSVLGWEVVREVVARYVAVPLRGVLRRAIRLRITSQNTQEPYLSAQATSTANGTAFKPFDGAAAGSSTG